MQRRSSQRRQIVMRSLVYVLMTVSVITIVTVLMLIILGYSFNRHDGRLEQGGLLQFASQPSGAAVTLDGVQLSARTPNKANVDAKNHFVEFSLKGYRPWQKSITVKPGGIGWLSYARLVPTDIKSAAMHTFPHLAASLASDDHKWIAAQPDTAAPTVTMVNVESDAPKLTEVAIPEAMITPATTDAVQAYRMVAWSDDDSRMIVKRTYDDTKIEWFVLNRQHPDQSVNLTTTFAIAAVDVKFGQNDGSKAYALTDDAIVRRIDIGGGTLSAPLAENVSEYSVYDESTLLYVTNQDTKQPSERRVGYRTQDMDEAQTIFNYASDTGAIHVDFSEYYGKQYVAVTYGTTMQVYVGDLPTQSNKGSLTLLKTVALAAPAQDLSISRNGRFVVATMPDQFTTYDIELLKDDTTVFSRAANAERPLQWLDDYLLASDREGTLRLFEFDGANQQDILPVSEGQATLITRNDKYLYTFAAVDGGTALTRVSMTVE